MDEFGGVGLVDDVDGDRLTFLHAQDGARRCAVLGKEMQKLDPSRFVGNSTMVEELHPKVLNDVDKLELQLRRNPNQPQTGQVRTSKSAAIPAGYEDAVAEYYRRLGKSQYVPHAIRWLGICVMELRPYE